MPKDSEESQKLKISPKHPKVPKKVKKKSKSQKILKSHINYNLDTFFGGKFEYLQNCRRKKI